MIDSSFSGITLKKYPINESDIIAHLFTKEFGLVCALAKGARKTTSKLSAHLEPLRLVRGRIIEKKRPRIVDALTINSFQSLKTNHKIHQEALEILSFIKNNTGPFQEDLGLWRLLKNSLKTMNEKTEHENHFNHNLFIDGLYKKINVALGF